MAEQADALGSNPGSSKECEFNSHQGDHQEDGPAVVIGDHVRGSTLGTTLFSVCFCRPNTIPGAECSTVGSAPGLGPGGRGFKSRHSDGQYCLQSHAWFVASSSQASSGTAWVYPR